jgi:hypothetical protein
MWALTRAALVEAVRRRGVRREVAIPEHPEPRLAEVDLPHSVSICTFVLVTQVLQYLEGRGPPFGWRSIGTIGAGGARGFGVWGRGGGYRTYRAIRNVRRCAYYVLTFNDMYSWACATQVMRKWRRKVEPFHYFFLEKKTDIVCPRQLLNPTE